jgi:anthranilate synthase component 1
MYFLDFGDTKVAGASPEMLLRCENRELTTRPIAGTRKRGETEEQDIALEHDLLNDKKEVAEHVMLVDLGRNDIGRESEPSTVNVAKFKVVERFSHVMHICSEVNGVLKKGRSAVDAFRACFPAGTLSGAPKIRAMQIIDELEPTSRGIYGGSIGYVSFNGNLDTAIAIRTVIFKGAKAYVQAGAGIVLDSVPQAEYQETCSKAKAALTAIAMAQ